jgi:abortive infection bacteriophage resistance protein
VLPPYAKPHLPIADQIALLEARGLGITDRGKAAGYLARIGYYRLSAYWHPLRDSTRVIGADGRSETRVLDQFRPGTTFKQAVELYVFDKRLRLLFLDAIERIEVALRVDAAHLLGARDPWAHRDKAQLNPKVATAVRRNVVVHDRWLSKLDEMARLSRDDFVIHFKSKYSSPLPLWIAVELWDYGMLTTFLEMMRVTDTAAIAKRHGIPNPALLVSWARTLNHVRNICAHHGRLWNRPLTDQPQIPRPGSVPLLDHLHGHRDRQTRVYAAAAAAQYLLRTINPTTTWKDRLGHVLATFPRVPGLTLSRTGFPADWGLLPLWR